MPRWFKLPRSGTPLIPSCWLKLSVHGMSRVVSPRVTPIRNSLFMDAESVEFRFATPPWPMRPSVAHWPPSAGSGSAPGFTRSVRRRLYRPKIRWFCVMLWSMRVSIWSVSFCDTGE